MDFLCKTFYVNLKFCVHWIVITGICVCMIFVCMISLDELIIRFLLWVPQVYRHILALLNFMKTILICLDDYELGKKCSKIIKWHWTHLFVKFLNAPTGCLRWMGALLQEILLCPCQRFLGHAFSSNQNKWKWFKIFKNIKNRVIHTKGSILLISSENSRLAQFSQIITCSGVHCRGSVRFNFHKFQWLLDIYPWL